MNNTILAALVADALDFPTELDNTFSDADVAARVEVDIHISEMNESAEIEENLATLMEAAQEYVDLVNRSMAAYERAELERDHETALLYVDGPRLATVAERDAIFGAE